MLDLNHPSSEYLLRASRLIDAIMLSGQKMTVSTSAERSQLLKASQPKFQELRALNSNHFGNSSFIAQAIDEYESGIRAVSALTVGEKAVTGVQPRMRCPHCDTPTLELSVHVANAANLAIPDRVCAKCDILFMPAKTKLESLEGFGTCAI